MSEVEDGVGFEEDSIPGMDLFVLRIRLGNAGMIEPEDIERALRKAGNEVVVGYESHLIMDINGNTVGSWALFNRAEEPEPTVYD